MPRAGDPMPNRAKKTTTNTRSHSHDPALSSALPCTATADLVPAKVLEELARHDELAAGLGVGLGGHALDEPGEEVFHLDSDREGGGGVQRGPLAAQ